MEDGIISDSAFPEKYNNTITGPKKRRTTRSSNMKSNSENALTSNAADAALKKKTTKKPENVEISSDKVAVWSNRNKHFGEFGSLKTGYNIINREAAKMWLTIAGVREATPEEIASYYGK